MRKKTDAGQITPEEKELLRRLMETPRVEREWDFFEGMSDNTPPPEFFMRGTPEPRYKNLRKIGTVAAAAAIMLASSVFIAQFMVPDSASADKKPFQILTENIQNGFLSMGSEAEGDDIASLETIIEDDEQKAVEVGLKVFPQLASAEFIPDNYKFDKLKIIQNAELVNVAIFLYKNDEGDILKVEECVTGDDAQNIFRNLITDNVEKDEVQLIYSKDEISENNMLTIWNEGMKCISVIGKFDDDTLKQVYESLK